MRDLFDRVCVISLDRSAQRLRQFYDDLPRPWPFKKPEKFNAIDGRKAPPPPSYPAKPKLGSWGCARSHYRVIEDALNQDLDSILVFEDDAIFVDDFQSRAEDFFEALPRDWEFIYLGGKHIERTAGLPVLVNELVYRPYNVHSSICYGLRGRRALLHLYHHLNSPENWGSGHCIDHRFGELHKDYPGGIYVPGSWLVGHRGGQSEIRGQLQPRAFFTSAEELVNPRLDKQMVVVVGTEAAGVTHTAWQLHLNGISMGDVRIANRALQFEDFSPGLRKLLAVLFDKDWWIPKTDIVHRVQMLRLWASHRAAMQSGNENGFLGVCHPQLGALGTELIDAWREPVFVIVEAPEKSSPLTAVQGSEAVQERLLRRGIEEIKTHARRQLCINPTNLDAILLVKQIIAEFSQK